MGNFQGYFTHIKKSQCPLAKNIKTKGLIKLIQISKDERFYLEGIGYKLHKHIVPTYTRYRHYFAIEDTKLVKKLKEYRKNRIIHG